MTWRTAAVNGQHACVLHTVPPHRRRVLFAAARRDCSSSVNLLPPAGPFVLAAKVRRRFTRTRDGHVITRCIWKIKIKNLGFFWQSTNVNVITYHRYDFSYAHSLFRLVYVVVAFRPSWYIFFFFSLRVTRWYTVTCRYNTLLGVVEIKFFICIYDRRRWRMMMGSGQTVATMRW